MLTFLSSSLWTPLRLPPRKHTENVRGQLDLGNMHIGMEGAEALVSVLPLMQGVARLDLSKNDLDAACISHLAEGLGQMTSLRELDLNCNPLKGAGHTTLAESVLPNMPQLRKLVFWHTGMDCTGALALAGALPSLKKLLTLDLDNNFIKGASAAALCEALTSFSFAGQLCLQNNSIGDEGAVALAKRLVGDRPEITEIALASNKIGPVGMSALAGVLPTLTNLVSVDLGSNSIGPEGAAALIEVLPSLTKLRRIDLSSNDIGPDGVTSLCRAVSSLPRLRELDLHSNGMDDEGATRLAKGLPKMKALREIYLFSSRISDEGAVAIANALEKTPTLRVLELNSNRMMDTGAAALAQALPGSGLIQLSLSANSIGESGLAELEAAALQMPNLNLEVGENPGNAPPEVEEESSDDGIPFSQSVFLNASAYSPRKSVVVRETEPVAERDPDLLDIADLEADAPQMPEMTLDLDEKAEDTVQADETQTGTETPDTEVPLPAEGEVVEEGEASPAESEVVDECVDSPTEAESLADAEAEALRESERDRVRTMLMDSLGVLSHPLEGVSSDMPLMDLATLWGVAAGAAPPPLSQVSVASVEESLATTQSLLVRVKECAPGVQSHMDYLTKAAELVGAQMTELCAFITQHPEDKLETWDCASLHSDLEPLCMAMDSCCTEVASLDGSQEASVLALQEAVAVRNALDDINPIPLPQDTNALTLEEKALYCKAEAHNLSVREVFEAAAPLIEVGDSINHLLGESIPSLSECRDVLTTGQSLLLSLSTLAPRQVEARRLLLELEALPAVAVDGGEAKVAEHEKVSVAMLGLDDPSLSAQEMASQIQAIPDTETPTPTDKSGETERARITQELQGYLNFPEVAEALGVPVVPRSGEEADEVGNE
ncbi:hypothetical protein KIPB_000309 [Kipferlia bialata]|uniref:Uncharacterized protein n=1 Tax=Kipferlia bialata TaxID=797122 RepID=A0A391NI15_9EUKA|nr:hypothetical protein KIPB_000309 [Kipferlia bialata]|eukprot:g309.t1